MSDTTLNKTVTSNASEAGERDFRDTLFLPRTDFPMKAGLPQREPDWLARWEQTKLYERLRAQSKGREKFILHDGPPYANGHLHIGTALNKILKDLVVRSQQMMGKDAPYVPGWDCHGLPIEWKVEERYREQGLTKDTIDIVEFRKECREFADTWIDIQRTEFQRLGGMGAWQTPYTTMSYEAEAKIVEEFQKFLMDGSLYRGSKPVMWSVVEKTALAEAEIEYHEHKSATIWARFKVLSGAPDLAGASVLIWTTTPWTMPGNRAVAYGEDITYGVYEVGAVEEKSLAKPGERVIVADSLAEEVKAAAKLSDWTRVGDATLTEEIVLGHPLRGHAEASGAYDYEVPLLKGDHVTEEAGTGFVHIAPGHGQEDYELAHLKHGIPIPFTVDEDGSYFPDVALFAGRRILDDKGKDGDANGAVIREMIVNEGLFAKGSLRHSYPHSWRSKAPLIFRNTPQWFVSMETNGLREKALKAIDETRWLPETGRNRIRSMVETRPDWVLSRQRAWGVPLTVFVNKATGELLRDAAVNARVLEAVLAEGADAWFSSDPARFLAPDYDPAEWEQVTDILDVWFDSGCTHVFTLEDREELAWPADLYLEGSDQHRGWFQSSLLESCGTRGRAPYKAVLTHGFVMDEKGLKMSKSLGNTVSPLEVCDQYGAEILRLWAASSDYTMDLRIGKEILKSSVDGYRRLRNTMRFLLGALADFSEDEIVPYAEMPELEKLILHRLSEMDGVVRTAYENFDFNTAYHQLFTFCTNELSAFYFDVRKDSLYCDPLTDPRRRACRTVLDILFRHLTVWFAPILCFTMEEVWLERFPSEDDSVHLRTFPQVPDQWRNPQLAEKWAKVRKVRRVLTGALEVARRDKRIGASLEAAPRLFVADAGLREAIADVDMAEVAITSGVSVEAAEPPEGAFTLPDVKGVGVLVEMAEGRKCARSWKILPEVGSHPRFPELTLRDAKAVEYLEEIGRWQG